MKVTELTDSQKEYLRRAYIVDLQNNDDPRGEYLWWDDVSDAMLEEYYAGVDFVEEDFAA